MFNENNYFWKTTFVYLQAWVTSAELDRVKKEREELTLKFAAAKRETEEKDKILATLQEDRKRHLAEVFEMK